MAARRVRFRVGPGRITTGMQPHTANYTRLIRQQMKAVEDGFTRFVNTIQANSPAAVEAALQPIFDRSQVLVPKKTGDLKNSGFIEVKPGLKGSAKGEVGYGRGGVPPYAGIVHENLDAQHAAPTQAKYLERAVDEELNGALDQAAGVYAETLGF